MLTPFEKMLREAVSRIAREEDIPDERAFAVWYCEVVLRLDRQEAVDASRFDGGNDHGVDVVYIDDELQRVVIAQAKYFKSSKKFPTNADVSLLLDTADVLADPTGLRDDGRLDLAEAADDVNAAREAGYVTRLHMVYPGYSQPALEAQIRAFNRIHSSEELVGQLLHLPELEVSYGDFMGLSGRVATGSLKLAEKAVIAQSGPYGEALVATVTGASLQALHEAHGDRLFDQNVRLFLGARKGSVNAGIEETIESSTDRGNFWAYNNGITIVAESFKLRSAKLEVALSKFSIVNGCQSTVLIGQSDPSAAADVRVLARIVAAPANLVDNIIRYTNSQTPIRVWEMSARDPEQQRLRRELDKLPEPWFYGFRRGEFEAVPDKARYGPVARRRTLPFPQAIQSLAAFRGLPVEAYKDKGRLFTTHKDRVLPVGLPAVEILWAWQVGQAIARALSRQIVAVAGDDQSTSILKRGATFYATAIAAQLLVHQNGPDYAGRVDPSRLLDKAIAERLDRYATVAVLYYLRATRQRLHVQNDLGIVLRSPDTNAELQRWTREELVQEAMDPAALDAKLPKLPKAKK
jgi:hypothetical protein